MEWQPIETAPEEDETYVLIWEKGLVRPIVGRFNQRKWTDETGEYDYQPTHWMPLPNPPAGHNVPAEPDGLRPFKSSARLGREDLERLGDWLEKNADMAAKITTGYSVAGLIDDLGAIEAGIHNERVDFGLVEGGD